MFITRFARFYTPFVLILAIGIATIPSLFFGQPLEVWIYRALVVLVISCPCALVVSIPLVYFAGIGKSSQNGILLKGANIIDALNDVSTVLWDKTGTLTVGEFKVIQVVPVEGFSPKEVIGYAALAESHSNHPATEQKIKKFWRWYEGFMTELIEGCIKDGSLSGKIDAGTQAKLVISTLAGVITFENVPGPKHNIKNITETLIKLLTA